MNICAVTAPLQSHLMLKYKQSQTNHRKHKNNILPFSGVDLSHTLYYAALSTANLQSISSLFLIVCII
jgi:hypothetical protein